MDAERLLPLLIRDLLEPATLALSSADSLRIELRRLLRDLRAFQVVRAALAEDAAGMPALESRTISKALAAVRTPDLILRGKVSGDLAVLSAPGALEMVLRHLLSNAQRHGRSAPISIAARRLSRGERPWPEGAPVRGIPAGYVLLTVSDAGPGVPAELIPRLFSPLPPVEPLPSRLGLGRGAAACSCGRMAERFG